MQASPCQVFAHPRTLAGRFAVQGGQENELSMPCDMIGPAFVEVYVHTPPCVCEQRDPKGLYRRARAGELRHLTGIDEPLSGA